MFFKSFTKNDYAKIVNRESEMPKFTSTVKTLTISSFTTKTVDATRKTIHFVNVDQTTTDQKIKNKFGLNIFKNERISEK